MRSRPSPSVRRQAGLSLIELMIAIAIGLMLVAAMGYLYVGQRQTWRALEAVARLQENGRFALELLGRDLRMAGYGGCMALAELKPALKAKLDKADKQPHFASLLNPFLAQGHLVRGYADWGVDRNLNGGLDSDDPGKNYVSGTDTLLVVGGGNPVHAVTAGMSGDAGDIPVGGSAKFRQGALALIADCAKGDVFRVSDANDEYASGSTLIEHASPLPHVEKRNTSSDLSKPYDAAAQVMPLNINYYYLRANPAGSPALYRLSWDGNGTGWGRSEELIEGVEAMRIVYGEDANGDGAVDVYRPAGDVDDWARVRAVRVSLLLVGAERSATGGAQRYYWDADGDGELDATPVAAPADGRLRMVFTSTYSLRNRP
ncbi:MAG: PilW family protein [Thiobacillaceae bacterium]